VAKKPKKAQRKQSDKSPQDVQTRIVLAAIACYAERGVEETTLREISKRAAIDPPLLKYYFPTLKELMLEVVKFLLEDLKRPVIAALAEEKSNSVLALENYAVATLRWAKENPSYFTLWMYFYHKATHDESFAAINNAIREGGRDRISLWIFAAREAKQVVNTSLTVAEQALAIQSFITGFTIVYGTETRVGLEACENMLRASLRTFLGASI
jgi:AcrR family transcriptional regulator